MLKKSFLYSLLIPLFLISCNQKEVYFNYLPVPASGWNKDSVLRFDFLVENPDARYDVFIHVRHYTDYPYQNFWMFIENGDSKGTAVKDTVECYLADEYGKWLGTGRNVREMPIFYKEQTVFPDSGLYSLQIVHGMRDTVLTGIKEIGVRIEKR